MCPGKKPPRDFEGSIKIAQLNPGDEVIIKAGCGMPKSDIDRTAVIADVHGGSAITGCGIKLRCDDAKGIVPTGRCFDEGDYEVTPEVEELRQLAAETPSGFPGDIVV